MIRRRRWGKGEKPVKEMSVTDERDTGEQPGYDGDQ